MERVLEGKSGCFDGFDWDVSPPLFKWVVICRPQILSLVQNTTKWVSAFRTEWVCQESSCRILGMFSKSWPPGETCQTPPCSAEEITVLWKDERAALWKEGLGALFKLTTALPWILSVYIGLHSSWWESISLQTPLTLPSFQGKSRVLACELDSCMCCICWEILHSQKRYPEWISLGLAGTEQGAQVHILQTEGKALQAKQTRGKKRSWKGLELWWRHC